MNAGTNSSKSISMFAIRSQHLSGVESVVTRLRTAIDLGFIEDGEMLPKEALLARELHVAPFTLREALAELRAEGLVDTKAGRGGGTFVQSTSLLAHDKAVSRLRDLSGIALRDLADWKAMLMGEAAELAARRASPANVAKLMGYCQRIAGARTPLTACRLHARFDVELAAVAQSVRLSAASLQVYEEYSWLLALAHDDQAYTQACAQTMEAVTELISQRLFDQAGSIARAKTRASFDGLARLRLQLVAASARDAFESEM